MSFTYIAVRWRFRRIRFISRSTSRFSHSLSQAPSCAIRRFAPRSRIVGRRWTISRPALCGFYPDLRRRCCWRILWLLRRTRLLRWLRPAWALRGSERFAIRFRYSLISAAIRTWRSASASCSVCTIPRTSTTPTPHAPSRSSGGAGICR